MVAAGVVELKHHPQRVGKAVADGGVVKCGPVVERRPGAGDGVRSTVAELQHRFELEIELSARRGPPQSRGEIVEAPVPGGDTRRVLFPQVEVVQIGVEWRAAVLARAFARRQAQVDAIEALGAA